jgi:hypothetical protein
VKAAEALERAAERIALEATNTRADAHDVGPRGSREAPLLAGDELMASARRLRILAAQERERPPSVRSVRSWTARWGSVRFTSTRRPARFGWRARRCAM